MGSAIRALLQSRGLALGLLGAAVACALASPGGAQVARRNVATLPFDQGVIVVDAHGDGRVVIGAAHGDSTIAIPLRAGAVREWADSIARFVARRVAVSRRTRTFRSTVTNPETGAGVTFTRQVTRGKSTYRLFFANTSYGGFPFEVSKQEADVLARALRRGVKTALAMPDSG